MTVRIYSTTRATARGAAQPIVSAKAFAKKEVEIMLPIDLEPYLAETPIINYNHPAISKIAEQILANNDDEINRSKAAFEFVRDDIAHSFDVNAQHVTCSASEVLEAGHGICYAKSHLLAALLRKMSIPAGICYQKLLFDDAVPGKICLHALNAAYIRSLKRWVRFDARGNKEGVAAEFSLKEEQLAYPIREGLGEKDSTEIYAEPLSSVLTALSISVDCIQLRDNLPENI